MNKRAIQQRVVLLTLIVLISVTSGAAARQERLIDSWKPINYKVSLVLDDKLTGITSAKAEITITTLKGPLSQIDLDFGDMTVDAVTVDAQTAQFGRPSGRLNIHLPKVAPQNARLVIVVSYHGKPKDGLILTADKAGKPSAVGDNWPNRLHHWVPCLDHPSAKATVQFTVTAPARTLVVANGKLDRVETTSNDTRTWSYTEASPIPPYCMIIAVGEFVEIKPREQPLTSLAYYVPPPDKDLAMQGFAPANPSLKFFGETIAPYPYEKLALIVGATRFGGMENSGAIVFGSTVLDPRPQVAQMSKAFNIREGLVSLVAHEIAHQWFGDSVTESTWSDLWLSEGFATYFAALFIQRHEGEEAFQRNMKTAGNAYLAYAKTTLTPLHDTETEDLMDLLNPNNYQKGSWVLHMLRLQLGDDSFFRGLRRYYEQHKGGTASSDDLRAALENSSGRNLKNFFERWVYDKGHPSYDLSWTWQPKTMRVRLMLRQLQSGLVFPNSVPVDVISGCGKRRIVLNPSAKESLAEVALEAAPLQILIDPEDTILKEARVGRAPQLPKPTRKAGVKVFRNVPCIQPNTQSQR
ncbi:MAG: M1 family metallopeptidase [Acidobacteriota bacterium]|nr:M1 family metallopeptidase [Acidobacteriota bacterium]